MNFYELLTLPDNLYWAWEKARRIYQYSDLWYDPIELSEFEANLWSELKNINNQFKNGDYQLSPLRVVPQPKRPNDDGKPQLRQSFYVNVRDQVAWIAFINILGPWLDNIMTPWSYGHRLFRSVWAEKELSGRVTYKFGWYRHASGHLYRKFNQGWPTYRRHLFLTLRAMTKKRKADWGLDESDKRFLDIEESKPGPQRLKYLQEGYWEKKAQKVFMASVDFEKFYPNIKTSKIIENMRTYLDYHYSQEIESIAKCLLNFSIDYSGFNESELNQIGLSLENKVFGGLPTGLFVAGFLSNISMMKIDEGVDNLIQDFGVAHFRYVDDHTFFSHDFDKLINWIDRYKELLNSCAIGVTINPEKTEPKKLRIFLDCINEEVPKESLILLRKAAQKETELDPRYPSPILTKTLTLMSNIATTPFLLLDDREQKHFFIDLEHLLLADFSDSEIRKGTRISFASTLISRLGPSLIEGEEHERNRIFSLLAKAIYEHPEKCRIWTRTLQFCKITGHADLSAIGNLLTKLKSNYLFCAYIRSFIFIEISKQIIWCAKDIISNDIPIQRRKYSLAYLKGLLNYLNRNKRKEIKTFYEERSFDLVKCSIGCAILIVANNDDAITTQKDYEWIAKKADELGAINWRKKPEEWAGKTEHSLSSWAWWAEIMASDQLAKAPSVIWKQVANELDPNDKISWSLWYRYPRNMPKEVVDFIISEKYLLLDGYINLHSGWFYDVSASMRNHLKKEELLNSSFGEFLGGPPKKERYITLEEWVEWKTSRYKVNPFDPRLSEWTTMEIVAQIIEQFIKQVNPDRVRELKTHIHPANYYIPKTWVRIRKPLSWERWRQFCRGSSKGDKEQLRIREGKLIYDDRFTPIWEDDSLSDLERAPLRGLSMLMLGLLSNSFLWPAAWNPKGHQRGNLFLALRYLRNYPCSSWTTAILESCLAPRSRESSLIPLLGQLPEPPDDDTTIDPPNIMNLDDFLKFIRRSQKVLERYQLTVLNQEPRQLIPILFEQLSRSKMIDWDDDEDNMQGAEE
jgi:hypothetical protein